MHDIMPDETEKWRFAENIMTGTARLFNYGEIRTPVIEEQSLFERSIGEDSDIISKEMYTFPDKKGRSLALRPEGTASVVRAFIESGISDVKKVTRLYYYGPMFRYDRPQKGRYRQFYQFGVELLGGGSPFFDGEVMEILNAIIKKLDIGKYYFAVNTLGCKECKEKYSEKIREYISSVKEQLCQDCRNRSEKAPLRILDCKNAKCRELAGNTPSVNEILCEACRLHFGTVKEYLVARDIPHKIQPNLVRGLDYYNRTVFEVYLQEDDNAIAAGGRYDSLVGELGGGEIPAVGFAIGMERILSFMGKSPGAETPVYFVCMGEKAKMAGAAMAAELRREGIPVEMDYEERTLKSHLKIADRLGKDWCLIMGEREMEKRSVLARNMRSGTQEEIRADNFAQEIKDLINRRL